MFGLQSWRKTFGSGSFLIRTENSAITFFFRKNNIDYAYKEKGEE